MMVMSAPTDTSLPRSPRQVPGVRRLAVTVFFVSVAVNAALGVAALVLGEFSETHARALGTSLAVTGAFLIALSCLPAWERWRLGPVPTIGTCLGFVAFTFVIVGLWSGTDSDVFARTMGTLMTSAVACAVACLLSIPTLAPRFRPALTAALLLIAIAGVMVVVGMWLDPSSSWYARSLGVVAVLLAAVAVSIPVLHRIGGPQRRGSVDTSFCPFCGAEHRAEPEQPTVCGHCGARFTVLS
jgi:hypothetical protein